MKAITFISDKLSFDVEYWPSDKICHGCDSYKGTDTQSYSQAELCSNLVQNVLKFGINHKSVLNGLSLVQILFKILTQFGLNDVRLIQICD